MPPVFNELEKREANVVSCRVRIIELEREFYTACAAGNWEHADRVRGVLIETVEAGLDATAAFFKALELGSGKG